MKLVSHGYSRVFQLKIIGYEYPELADEAYDSNWLSLEIHVLHPSGSWTSRSPCLLTYEIEKLADWLERIDRGEEVNERMKFMEPNLEFILVRSTQNQEQYIRIYFETAFRPDWAPWTGIMKDLWIEFPTEELALKIAAESLRQQLAGYPKRTDR